MSLPQLESSFGTREATIITSHAQIQIHIQTTDKTWFALDSLHCCTMLFAFGSCLSSLYTNSTLIWPLERKLLYRIRLYIR